MPKPNAPTIGQFDPQAAAKWSKLHAALRQKPTKELISSETKRRDASRAQREHPNLKVSCLPLPAPLTLPKVDLISPKVSNRLDEIKTASLGSIFAAEKAAASRIAPQAAEPVVSAKNATAVKNPATLAASGEPARLSPLAKSAGDVAPKTFTFGGNKESSANAPNQAALTSPPPPAQSESSENKPSPASFSFSFKPFTSPTSSSGESAFTAKSRESTATAPASSSGGLFSFGFTASPKPSTQESIPSVSLKGDPSNMLGTTPPLVPESPIKGMLEDASRVESPTPKGRKGSINEQKEGEEPTLGPLSIGGEETGREGVAAPSLFGIPAVVAEITPSAPTKVGGTANAFGFRPSALESAAPSSTTSLFGGGDGMSSAFATPLATPTKSPPLFAAPNGSSAAAPAFGSASLFGAQLTFGAPLAFGVGAGAGPQQQPTFGQATSFGVNPSVPAAPSSSAAASGGGFAAYASASVPTGGSLFGAASTTASGPHQEAEKKKTNLPPSFTQFRA